MYVWGVRSPSQLGSYLRGPIDFATARKLRRLGDDISVGVDPTLLYAGLGVLALAALLYTGKRARQGVRKYQRSRLQGKRRKLQQQLFALGES